jgi:hypothetical protein
MPGGASSINATRMTKRYRMFLPKGSVILNFANKATGKDCMICGHTPEKRPPKPGYPSVSEEMRVLRVKLPEGTKADDVAIGRKDFTVTERLIEINCCADTYACRERATELKKDDGTPMYDPQALALFL